MAAAIVTLFAGVDTYDGQILYRPSMFYFNLVFTVQQ